VVIFFVAIIFSVVAVYFSVYADTANSHSNTQYGNSYVEPEEEARVGVVVRDGGVQNATS
jgi:hypothetical protein